MKHVVNLLMLMTLLMGLAVATDYKVAWIAVFIPILYWGVQFMLFIHTNLWLAVILWGAVALYSWQFALIGFALGLLVKGGANAIAHSAKAKQTEGKIINLPVVRTKPEQDEELEVDPRRYDGKKVGVCITDLRYDLNDS